MKIAIISIFTTLLSVPCSCVNFGFLKGKRQALEIAVEKDAPYLKKQDVKGNVKLHRYIIRGKDDKAKIIINGERCLAIQNNKGKTALHLALDKGNEELAKLMICKESQVLNLKDKNGNLPIHLTLIKNYVELATMIISKEDYQLLKVPNHNGSLALHLASSNGYEDLAKLMIFKDPQMLNAKDNYSNLPVHLAIKNGHEELAKWMISENSRIIRHKNADLNRPAHLAAAKGFVDIIQLIINKNGSIIMRNKWGNEPIHVAATNNRANMVRFLIGKGIHAEQRNGDEFTALQLAAIWGAKEVVEVLIKEFGANVEANSDKGANTPLALSVTCGKEETAKTLIKLGANKHYKYTRGPSNGMTIFHLAVRALNVKMAQLLIDEGVDGTILGFNGNTNLHFVPHAPKDTRNRRKKVSQMLEWLLLRQELHTSAYPENEDGHTVLSYAVALGDLDTIRYFADKI